MIRPLALAVFTLALNLPISAQARELTGLTIVNASELESDPDAVVNSLSTPIISQTGEVLFTAGIVGLLTQQGASVLLSNSSATDPATIVLQSGSPTPDADGNLGGIQMQNVFVNKLGDLFLNNALIISLDPSKRNRVFYQPNGSEALEQIFVNEALPDNRGVFQYSRVGLSDGPFMVANGIIIKQGEVPASVVARRNLETGELFFLSSGETRFLTDFEFSGPALTADPVVNSQGQMAISARLIRRSPLTAVEAVLRTDGEEYLTVAKDGDVVPGEIGGEFAMDQARVVPLLDETGRITFFSLLQSTPGSLADNQGIYRFDGAEGVELARKGEPTPSGDGRYANLVFTAFAQGILSNAKGSTLFPAELAGATAGRDRGLFLARETDVIEVVRTGDAAPAGGTISGFFRNVDTFALNAADQVVFMGSVLNDNRTSREVLFFFDPVRGLHEIASTGDMVEELGQIGTLSFNGYSNSAAQRYSTGLNDLGQVTFKALAGVEAIALWSLPEDNTRTVTPGAITRNESELVLEFQGLPENEYLLEQLDNPSQSWNPTDQVISADAEGRLSFTVTLEESPGTRLFRSRRSEGN